MLLANSAVRFVDCQATPLVLVPEIIAVTYGIKLVEVKGVDNVNSTSRLPPWALGRVILLVARPATLKVRQGVAGSIDQERATVGSLGAYRQPLEHPGRFLVDLVVGGPKHAVILSLGRNKQIGDEIGFDDLVSVHDEGQRVPVGGGTAGPIGEQLP